MTSAALLRAAAWLPLVAACGGCSTLPWLHKREPAPAGATYKFTVQAVTAVGGGAQSVPSNQVTAR